ncbi:hypothetical protein BCR44DRAFT_281637 [Catenaria anguillulae PL171]|uniref:Uncharacterized protein n=1 Tax=Catenaria anguillulae PL171 TaxID=765915 RepID=A0A1Y2HF30_9FUNG|nr:hypothetical protein BCR44DRAFT_281637 [Catenaria anguillulae PL171]
MHSHIPSDPARQASTHHNVHGDIHSRSARPGEQKHEHVRGAHPTGAHAGHRRCRHVPESNLYLATLDMPAPSDCVLLVNSPWAAHRRSGRARLCVQGHARGQVKGMSKPCCVNSRAQSTRT